MAQKKKQIKKGKKGFTIIEVVLVLAIAGLIFLMVFIALPALQRGQRNTQRADDLGRILTAINAFQANNNGNLPFEPRNTGGVIVAATRFSDDRFVRKYIDDRCPERLAWNTSDGACGDQFTDPDGNAYRFNGVPGIAAVPNDDGSFSITGFDAMTFREADHTIFVALNANCGAGEATVRTGTGPRQVALFMVLEGNAVTCNDNQ